ncbi:MAG: S-layer homology domain-containing protein [Candidatus Peregrinibacteria bacterium]
MTTKRLSLSLIMMMACALLPTSVQTQSVGMITVDQEPAEGFSVLGDWALLKPDGTHTLTNVASHTYEATLTGKYLLNVMPPSGMSANITLTLNGETVIIEKPQAAFELSEGSTVNLKIQYTLAISGKVGVDTSPPGFGYTLSGPDDAIYTGVSPGYYDPMPIGLYSVTFDPIEGCNTPSPQSGRLIKEGRVTLSVEIACDNLPQLKQQQDEERASQFVKATIDGKPVIFEDVPVGQWFTAAVRRVLSAKVMSGYRDAKGVPTGQFGPSDPVTLAELAKIVHRLASIDETRIHTEPENIQAKGAWFAPFVASAEQHDWLVFINRSVDPLRPATRAEVVATFLQVLNVPREWPTGSMFRDVSRTIPYASCIETAASHELVAGYTDDEGNPTGLFGPADPINRAAMAKMISAAMELYFVDSPLFNPNQ